MKNRWFILVLLLLLPIAAACYPPALPANPATPTIDPDIYNQTPKTTVFGPGQCTAVLASPAAAYTSNTLGGQSSGQIPAGQYEVGVKADYGSSVWYMLNNVGSVNWINSTSVSSLSGDCTTPTQ